MLVGYGQLRIGCGNQTRFWFECHVRYNDVPATNPHSRTCQPSKPLPTPMHLHTMEASIRPDAPTNEFHRNLSQQPQCHPSKLSLALRIARHYTSPTHANPSNLCHLQCDYSTALPLATANATPRVREKHQLTVGIGSRQKFAVRHIPRCSLHLDFAIAQPL